MTDMVEKVARVICETLFGFWDENDDAPTSPKGQSLIAARAAIATTREPTEEMRVAALNCGLPGAGDPPLYEMVWRSMIDAALKERPSSDR